ncbi:MAG: dihydroneopterin aldolase [Proteobacteria bacterium]|nr:dihydroneopterin aldolase [Pseudomonadota bacterium]
MSQATPLRPAPLADGGARARRIFIHDLTLDCRIGVHRHEQDAGQRVRINIELAVRDGGPIDDKIANVVSYDDIVAGVKAIVARGHVNLVETLAERIGDFCMADARVAAVRVRVEKLDAIREAASVGVEIERGAERC